MTDDPDDLRIRRGQNAWGRIKQSYAEQQVALWAKWRLQSHARSSRAMMEIAKFVGMDDTFSIPEPALLGYAAVLNYFFAEFEFTEQDHDTSEEMYAMLDCWNDPAALADWLDIKEAPKPDDWYLWTAERMGLIQRDNWQKLDETVRWLEAFEKSHGYSADLNDDLPDDVALGKFLCNLI